MNNRLKQTLQTMRSQNERGVSPFLMAGDGGLPRTKALLHALEKAGARCCELGVPFSDPIADGPTLQAAASRALSHGTHLQGVFNLVREYRKEGGQLPIVLMSYCNPLFRLGWAQACAQAADSGVDAFAIPDLPPQEASPLVRAAKEHGVKTVFFAARTSSDQRIREAAALSTGFLYIVGRTGVTGTQTEFDRDLSEFLAKVQALVPDTPTAMGFGISCAKDVTLATQHVDLAIVGSALVKAIHQSGPDESAAVQAASRFLQGLGCSPQL